jgi:peptidoglycan/xylan/chitin deacetylase (PgdA/CDA1 family)
MASAALVLTYHRVADGRDPLQQCVSPEHFAAQLDALAHIAEMVPLCELERHGSARRVAVTFDDGYRDNATAAAPLLRAAGAPATFFVPSRIVGDPAEFWWDRLEHAHFDEPATAPALLVEIAGTEVRIDIRDAAGVYRSLKTLNRRLRSLPPVTIEDVVGQVEAQLGTGRGPCAAHALLSAGEVAELAANPLFEIGAHGTTHTMLTALSSDEQRTEVVAAKNALEQAAGRAVTSFAYPYGTPESFDATTLGLVKQAGYERACRNTGGTADVTRERYSLARHMVYDWTGDELVRHVRGWFAGA